MCSCFNRIYIHGRVAMIVCVYDVTQEDNSFTARYFSDESI